MESKNILLNAVHVATVKKYSTRDYGYTLEGIDPPPHIRGCFPTEEAAEEHAKWFLRELYQKLQGAFK